MDIVIPTAIGVVSLAFIFLIFWKPKAYKLPPIKRRLSIIFSKFSSVETNYRELVDDLAFGDVYICDIGFKKYYRLNSVRAIHEALVVQSPCFSGRINGPFPHLLFHHAGLIHNDGPGWLEQRRFIMRTLKELGIGKARVNDLVVKEVRSMIDGLDDREGQPVDAQEMFNCLTSDVIAILTLGEGIDVKSKHYNELIKDIDVLVKSMFSALNSLPYTFPIIVQFPIFRWIFSYFSPYIFHAHRSQKYVRKKIEECKASMKSEPISKPSTICEALLFEMEKQEKVNPGNHNFRDINLTMVITDLFMSGAETASTTLTWAVLLLSLHPNKQALIHKEIAEKIGKRQVLSIEDKYLLPYVCATMDEVLRYSSLLPFNGVRRTLNDTELFGYHIPANVFVQSNIYGIHHDPNLWKRPNDFYPEHFLTSSGEYCPSSNLIAFSAGARSCLGEPLGRLEFFIALVSLMQRYKFKLFDPNCDLKSLLNGTPGLVRHPLPHKIIFERVD